MDSQADAFWCRHCSYWAEDAYVRGKRREMRQRWPEHGLPDLRLAVTTKEAAAMVSIGGTTSPDCLAEVAISPSSGAAERPE